jgi:TRAP-type C4-dicarboxylate transport system substrate-binding protein
MPCRTHRPLTHVLALVLAIVLLAGCDAGSPRGDKAGGNGVAQAPTVLRLATSDATQRDIAEFVAAVQRVSHGSLRIEVQNGRHANDVDYETELIADVRSGRVAMAQVGARAFDLVGVRTLDPLVAPFIVESLQQQQRILEGPARTRMLSGLGAIGLVGVALLPGDLRYPLGITRELRTAADFRAATIGIRPSRITAATMRALGARPVGFISGGPLAGLDGAEEDAASILGNGYDRQATTITYNLPLWPRSQVIAMNGAAFRALSPPQREILERAGRDVLEPATRRIARADAQALRVLCASSRFTVVAASDSDIARIKSATAPVITSLMRDHLAGPILREIERTIALVPRQVRVPLCRPLPGGQAIPPTGRAGALVGVWTGNATRDRYYAAKPLPGENNEANWGRLRLTLTARGRFTVRNERFPPTSTNGAPVRGTFRIRGAELDLTPSADTAPDSGGGETWRYQWSLFHDKLTLHRQGPDDQPTALIAAPLIRSS